MDGRAHLGIGLVSAGCVLWVARAAGVQMGTGVALAGAAASGLGSLAPDIDHPDSLIGSRIPAMLLSLGIVSLLSPLVLRLSSGTAGMFAGVWNSMLPMADSFLPWGALMTLAGGVLLFVSFKVSRATEHRGPLHSLVFAAAAAAVVTVVFAILGQPFWFGLLFGFGWVMHLLADLLTPAGLPYLLWPSPPDENLKVLRPVGLLVIPIVFAGVAGWASAWQSGPVSTPAVGASAPVQTGGAAAGTNVALARQRLQEAAPEIAAALVNAESPAVTSSGDNSSYTWQYADRPAANQVVMKTITVTLDGSGRVVGVPRPESR